MDVKNSQVNRLLAEIEKQHVYDEAHKILDALKEEFDQEQIAYKLISLLMERNTVAGPNQIGISAERMEKILHNLQTRGNDSGGNRRGGGYRGNNNRGGSGGGGGYRGNNDRNASGGGERSSSGGGYRGNNDRNASGERSGGGERGDRSRSFSGQNRPRS
jgi:ATP-dependent RNA helicase DeaD